MNWIQFFNIVLDHIIRFWKELDFIDGVVLIWVFGLILYKVLIPAIKYILYLPLRRKEKKIVLSYCNKNLKAHSFFLDHAAGAYVIAESSISIDNEKEFKHGEDILNSINLTCPMEINEQFPIPTCYGVSYFSHNRLQAIEADEAHWFTIKLYNSDVFTRGILQEVIKLRPKSVDSINQAIDINSLYPFVTCLRVAVNVYYEHWGKFFILSSKYNSFFLETEVSPDIYDGHEDFNTKLPRIFDTNLNTLSIKPTDNILFSDIGFDPVNNCLYIIGQLAIKDTRVIKKQFIHKSIDFVFHELDHIDDGNMTPRELLFIYSVANLRSRLYSK